MAEDLFAIKKETPKPLPDPYIPPPVSFLKDSSVVPVDTTKNLADTTSVFTKKPYNNIKTTVAPTQQDVKKSKQKKVEKSTPNQTPTYTAQVATQAAKAPEPLAEANLTLFDPAASIDYNNKFRPFTTSIIEHDPNTATIVLAMKTVPPASTLPKESYNYFVNFYDPIPTDQSTLTNKNQMVADLPLISGGQANKYYGIFKNFTLMGYQESRVEITKVSMNFSLKWNAYFFGSQPRIYMFTGMFLDSKNYPYYEAFMRAYDNYLSGGKCISNGFRTYIAYDGKVASGWMIDIAVTGSSEHRFLKQFSFKILVDDENWVRSNYEYDDDGNFVSDKGKLSNRYQLGLNA